MNREQQNAIANKTVRNSLYSLVFFLLPLLAQFLYRRYFIQVLGDDLLGLNGTLTSILNFLNLAELGLATAVGFSLYKPIVEGDKQTVSEIISLQGWIYRIIAIAIALASCILMFFFPHFFAEMLRDKGIPMWYAYATFWVLLLNSLAGYFFNYRQIILFSDLRGYKVTLIIRGSLLIKLVLQVFAFLYYKQTPQVAYIAWLIIEGVATIAQTLLLEWIIKKDYPWLHTDINKGNKLRLKHPAILRKTSQLFLHKFTYFVVTMSTPLIIAIVLGSQDALYKVAVYQNYVTIYSSLTGLFNSLFSAVSPAIGNLRAAKIQSRKIEELFRSLLSLRILLALLASFGFYYFSKDLMLLWVGGDRFFSQPELLLFSIYCFMHLSRNVDQFIEAYGMFQDIWAPIAEAIILLVLSFVLGRMYGLSGIFIGSIVSAFIIICCWKPYFLYRYGFGTSPLRYVKALFPMIAVMAGIGVGLGHIKMFFYPTLNTWGELLVGGVCFIACFVTLSVILGYLLLPDFKRGSRIILNKLRKTT